MKKEGPTLKQLEDFRDRVTESVQILPAWETPTPEKLHRGFYGLMALETGCDPKTIRRYFTPPGTSEHRECTFAVWRLWHLVIFMEDIKK